MIKNILLLVFTFCFLQKNGYTQLNELLVTTVKNGVILNHAVQAKENWYSIGRLYNVHPKELAVFNKTTVDKGLKIGQAVQVPITTNNRLGFFDNLADGEGKYPLYYIIKKGDVLNKVAIANGTTREVIRTWNNLNSDSIFINQKLMVGYLKLKIAESALINNDLSAIPTYATPPIENKPIVKTDTLLKDAQNTTTQVAPTQVVKVETRPNAPTIVHTKPNATVGVTNNIEVKKNDDEKPIVVAKPKQTDITATTNTKVNDKIITKATINNKVGFYGKGFDDARTLKQIEFENCGTFKSNAGWDDDKYFIMTSAVPTGSIVKLQNPTNEKVVYAMVLDDNSLLKKTKQNDCNISIATAYALGIKDTNEFKIKVETN